MTHAHYQWCETWREIQEIEAACKRKEKDQC